MKNSWLLIAISPSQPDHEFRPILQDSFVPTLVPFQIDYIAEVRGKHSHSIALVRELVLPVMILSLQKLEYIFIMQVAVTYSIFSSSFSSERISIIYE